MYPKAKLIKFWKFKFHKVSNRTIDVSVPAWHTNVYDVLRVERQNSDEFIVARPARGGTFDTGYAYQMRGKLRGYGYACIITAIKNSRTMREFKINETYTTLIASAINVARLMLL